MVDNTHMSVVVNTSFWKILILLKIHIVIDFVSKVQKTHLIDTKSVKKIKKHRFFKKNVKQIQRKTQKKFHIFKNLWYNINVKQNQINWAKKCHIYKEENHGRKNWNYESFTK